MASVTLQLDLDADRERVWRSFTDAAELAAWFWPQRLAAVVTFAGEPGAAWRIESPVAGMAVGGTVTEVDAPNRLVMTWAWDGEAAGDEGGDPSTVSVSLTDRSPGCTTLRLFHDGLADGDDVANHEQGWRDCLGRLAASLSPPSGG